MFFKKNIIKLILDDMLNNYSIYIQHELYRYFES